MLTKNDIVELALQELKVIDLVDASSAEQLGHCSIYLNGLLDEGRQRGFVWWLMADDNAIPEYIGILLAKVTASRCALQFGNQDIDGSSALSRLYLLNPSPRIISRLNTPA